MNSLLIKIFGNYYHPSLDEFLEAISDHELVFWASSLDEIFEDHDEMASAMNRAMQICINSGLPIRNHFRAVYKADNLAHSVRMDWKLSKLAYILSVINGNPENPRVGQIQIQLLKQMIL